MPVVSVNSNLFPAWGQPDVDPARARGRLIIAAGRVDNAADDLSLSKYRLADLPAEAILDPATRFQVENTGFAAIRIGTETDVGALVSQTKATEAVVTPVALFGARWNRPLWEVLGLSAPPNSGVITLWQHAIANATGAGHLLFDIHYRFR